MTHAATVRSRPCPACGANASQWAFIAHGYPHVSCMSCGTLFVSPLPPREQIEATYLRGGYHANATEHASRMRQDAKARARRLYDRGVRSVLEVGCGPGFFLDEAMELGMAAEGIDRAPTAVMAKQRGHSIHEMWAEDFRAEHPVDAVVMYEVLEHLAQPVSMLCHVASWLRPQGWLSLSTPSVTGVPARVLGSRFPMVAPPDHLELFSREGLEALLERAGFDPQSWSSFSSLDRDTLARNFSAFALGHSPLAKTVAQSLAAVTAPPMRWIDRAGLGTSFDVLARKR